MLTHSALYYTNRVKFNSVNKRRKYPSSGLFELAPESWTGLILVGYGFKGLIPILYRGQALETLLKSIVVVPEDVIINSLA